MRHLRSGCWVTVVVVLAAIAMIAEATAATVYGTVFTNPGQLVRIDTNTGQVVTVAATGNSPDSLVFDASGRIIYSVFGANQVRRFDPATGTDVLLSGAFSGPLDLALEPGGATVLVSNNLTPRIDRLNLSTGVVTPFFASGGGGGVVYDTSGRLFANLPGLIAQLNPQTATAIQTGPVPASLDGLTFDPVTGSLFATDGSGGRIYRYNPSNLAAGATLLATIVPSGGFVDGIAADGTGNLFVAVRILANESQSGLFRVNATTGAFTQVAFAASLDDIAPLAGLGAPPPVTVPATFNPNVPTLSEMALIALALIVAAAALVALRRRRAS